MTFRTNSLRFRFLVSTALWVGLGLVAAGFLVSAVFRWNIIAGYHDEMRVHVEELSALTVLDADGQPRLLRRLSDPRYLPQSSGFYWQIERAGFRTLTSPSLGEMLLDGKIASSLDLRFAWVDGPNGEMLEYGRVQPSEVGGPPLKFLMASDKRLVDETMAEFNKSLALALLSIALLMVAAGVFQVAYGLRPLNRLGIAIANVRSGRSARMTGNYPAEISPLVTDLNALLEAKSDLVARSRLRASNLAHGLRTPLAILMDEAERLESLGHGDTARTVVRETARMKRQIEYHLARARSFATRSAPGTATPIMALVDVLLPAMSRLHATRSICFECTTKEDLVLACDEADLFEILSNLTDNAGKWANSRCTISWAEHKAVAEIHIEDDGPGMSPDCRERVFAAGERLDDATPGTGLGLAITRELVEEYGGSISLVEADGGGTCVIVRLPVIQDAQID